MPRHPDRRRRSTKRGRNRASAPRSALTEWVWGEVPLGRYPCSRDPLTASLNPGRSGGAWPSEPASTLIVSTGATTPVVGQVADSPSVR
jgi:hypothetical protein